MDFFQKKKLKIALHTCSISDHNPIRSPGLSVIWHLITCITVTDVKTVNSEFSEYLDTALSYLIFYLLKGFGGTRLDATSTAAVKTNHITLVDSLFVYLDG